MDDVIPRQSSIKEKLKNSICCFTGNLHHNHHGGDSPIGGEGFYNKLHIPRMPISPSGSSGSPSSWFKKSPTSNGGEFSRIRGRSQRCRMGRKHQHRQSQSADFSYDPSSYALNFENETAQEDIPIMNFSSRLPRSPPRSPQTITYSGELPKEIVGYS